ncbi:MAG: glycosyltransferase family 39 protein [Bacteroidetes bacterium]|nr:glycosyltransferase family 39 protein [Bacteroidota bacterium]
MRKPLSYDGKSLYFLPVVIILLLLFIYSLYGRMPDEDDAWIGEYAYWFAEDGYVHSELMRGINSQEVNFVVHHKLFNFNGALFINLFGFSLYTLKAVSLLYFVIFLLLFYFYTRKWKKLFNRNDFWLSLLIIFSFPWIFKFAFIYRPEIMLMTLGFVGFILLESFLAGKKNVSWQLFLAGVFFGLSMSTHLNGIILMAAGFFLLILNKRYSAVIVYGIGVLLAFSIYFYDLTDAQSIALWKHQFFESPSLDSLHKGAAWLKPVANLLNEHMRYFHNLKIIIFSTFLIAIIIIGYKYLSTNHTRLFQFAILIAIITGVVAMHKSRHYFLLNFPYMVLLIVLTIKAIYEGKITVFKKGEPKQIKGLLFVLFIIFVGVSTYFNIQLSIQKFSSDQNRELAKKYTSGNTTHMKIVAPMTFIFNEIKNFEQIQGELCYTELQKLDSTIYGKGFLKRANDFDRDLILVAPRYQQMLGISAYQKGDEFEHYFVLDKTEELIVFKRKP